MSNNYRWKDRYYDVNEVDTAILGRTTKYVSQLASANGDGSRENPFKPTNTPNGTSLLLILSSGFSSKVNLIGSSTVQAIMFGQGMDKTTIGLLATSKAAVLYDATLLGGNIEFIVLYRCAIRFPVSSQNNFFMRCIVYEPPLIVNSSTNNSFVKNEYKLSSLLGQNSLFCNSDIEVSNIDITNRHTTYYAFSNCRFKIANENEYTSLKGNTEEELRSDFVSRCEAQGIVVPNGSEYNEKDLPIYRWVFSNEPNNHGNVVKESIIHKFQKRRFISFGWNPDPIEEVPITNDKTKPQSLSYLDGSGNLTLKNGTVVLSEDIDISDMSKGRQSGTIRSNIIWLGEGKQKLNAVNIHHNLAMQYGVMIDSDPSIVPIANGTIKEGEFYQIRSKSAGKETLTYNSEVYSTSLSDSNNIFVGVKDFSSWEASDNIIVYKVNDLAVSGTIRMRIVDEMPTEAVTKTRSGYWYFVEPKDLNNPQGEVIYKGLKYPAFGSFLADTAEDVTTSADCYLREAWKDDESDLTFWKDKQKPKWFHLVPDDPRCLLVKNNPLSTKMAYDIKRKTYITSGHPDFYAMVTADNGTARPAYDITGKYLQIELVISTLNPM